MLNKKHFSPTSLQITCYMPIEIKELIIKTTVGENEQSGGVAGETSSGENMDAIIRACVEKVMEKLKEKQER